MDDTAYNFVSKFRIDNLEFTVFANKVGNYFVVNKDIENGIQNGIQKADFYINFEQLHDIFSDEISDNLLRGKLPN